jgi:hypothetical protein
MSLCVFLSGRQGTLCEICGFTLSHDLPLPIRRMCDGPPCIHLGPPIERDGVVVMVKCSCVKKEMKQLHTAHRCEIHRRCLPTLVPDDLAAWMARVPESELYHLCQGCLDRKPTPTATPTSSADRTAAS